MIKPPHVILQDLPPARRDAALRAAGPEIQSLLSDAFNAVGLPKENGQWSPQLSHALKDVAQKMESFVPATSAPSSSPASEGS